MVFGLDPTRRLTMTTDFWHTDPTLADESSPFELIFDLVFRLMGFWAAPGLLVGLPGRETKTPSCPRRQLGVCRLLTVSILPVQLLSNDP